MLKTESANIDGSTYEVTQLTPRRAMRLSVRIGKVLGPALAKASGAAKAGGDTDISAFGDAVATLFDSLTPDELEFVSDELLYSLTRETDGKKLSASGAKFDLVMAGESVMTIYKILRFAFEVNYGNFTSALVARFQAAMAKDSSS